MKSFSVSRFGQLLKWDLFMNKKYLMRLFIGMFMAFFIVLFVMGVVLGGGIGSSFMLSMVMMWFYLMLGGCWMFSTMQTQQQRLNFLMQPASNVEKFAVRWVFVTVVWAFIGIAAYLLADVLQYALSHVASIWTPEFATSYFSMPTMRLFGNEVPLVLSKMLVLFLLGIVWHHSLFMLGGTFFRRHQFIFTALALFVVSQVFTVLVFAMGMNINWEMYTINEDVLYYYIVFGLAALIILDYVLSFRIFKRMQIINNKWMNV
ncbi:MAG: hypothetical protein IJ604_11210 [Prevotella sp.]|nr:hypothetical protein [Prevotella sp.]